MLLFPGAARSLWIAGLFVLASMPAWADEKVPVERSINDRQIIDLLADLHERGRLLYNAGDYAGCFRLFEGSLVTVRPLLPKEMQQMITMGIPDADRQPNMARRAMLLHDLMENIRVKLRPTAGPGAEKLMQPRPVAPGGAKGGDPQFDAPRGPGKVEEPPPPIRLPTLGTPTKGPAPGESAEPALASPKADAKPPTGNPPKYTNEPVDVPAITFDDPKSDTKRSPPATKPKDEPKPVPTPPIIIGGGAPKLDPPPIIPPKDAAPTSPAPPSPKDDGKSVPPIVIPLPDGK